MTKVNEISFYLIIDLAKGEHLNFEVAEKPASERLMENVQMQGFRNPEE